MCVPLTCFYGPRCSSEPSVPKDVTRAPSLLHLGPRTAMCLTVLLYWGIQLSFFSITNKTVVSMRASESFSGRGIVGVQGVRLRMRI